MFSKLSFSFRGALFVFPFCLLLSCAHSSLVKSGTVSDDDWNKANASAENGLPIQVGPTNLNFPLVSVTICIPNTDTCQKIDKIKLDTGTVGLRIYKSAVSISLPSVAAEGGNMALCQVYGGGSNMWGPLKLADVGIANEKAKDVTVQIVEENFAEPPEQCPRIAHSVAKDGANGQLGINLGKTDKLGSTYYLCSDNKCQTAVADTFQRIKNPIALLPQDNNGVTIVFQNVPPTGLTGVTGSLFLGVGTRPNNTPPTKTLVCKPGEDGFLHVRYEGKEYWSMFDTGTNANNLGRAVNLGAHCKKSDGTQSPYLCPLSLAEFNPEIINRDGSLCGKLNLEVLPYDYKSYAQGIRAVSGLTMQWGQGTSGSVDFGMPFFYGRSVYFVIDGKDSKLGKGPLVAF